MILCLDSGNTRIKWGMHDGVRWLVQGAVDQAAPCGLSCLIDQLARPDRIMLANVAGEPAAARINSALAAWGVPIEQVRAEAVRAGVTNLYNSPAQLGVDRWCALVGAWHLLREAAVVVMAGTATTVDTLDADGQFLGGMILPGIALMHDSLRGGTAELRRAGGRHQPWPRCTEDAMTSGVLEAQAGAIERAFRRLQATEKSCVISGGNADGIAACLEIPCRVAHNLPLDGMLHIAGAPGSL